MANLLSPEDDRDFTFDVGFRLCKGVFSRQEINNAVAMGCNAYGGGRDGWFLFSDKESAVAFEKEAPVSRSIEFIVKQRFHDKSSSLEEPFSY